MELRQQAPGGSYAVIMTAAIVRSAGLLQPLLKELTNKQDPLTCLAALSLLKEQMEQASTTTLKVLLAGFFLPHLEQLLAQADSIVKPTAMQACPQLLASCHLHLCCICYACRTFSSGLWCEHQLLVYKWKHHLICPGSLAGS